MKTTAVKMFLSFLVITFISFSAFADGKDPIKDGKTVKVTGKVVDKLTGETLTGVKIVANNCDKAVYTDFDGNFEIECNQNNSLNISLISYESVDIKITNSGIEEIQLDRQK
ncbi:MAG: carboxypeptidase-like regulatory domain-containing protein [Bacteroidales bacterium]